MRSLKWKLCNFCESFWQTLLVCLFLKGKEELVAWPLHTAQGEEELAETLRGEQGAVCVCSARTARSFPTISQGKSCAWTCSFCSSLGDSIPHLPNCWEPSAAALWLWAHGYKGAGMGGAQWLLWIMALHTLMNCAVAVALKCCWRRCGACRFPQQLQSVSWKD